MDKNEQTEKTPWLKKDLLAVLILSLVVVAIMVGLSIWEQQTGQISQLAHNITEYLIK